ncbi:putative diguanylate cyclase YdaM [Marinomonas aquimarina]|uniref:diguanylate cyclase n=1 Tax=Marinomonas aquimarina TaxID=295068 RepID=A0A1A8TJX1_9GAMM|nr:GGDEF domain-containing protein [Marinomonas aquimarina]SBS32880.1 putative diguanylate cyclase YdaM [Marinomonas aquimarina]
MAEVTGHLRKSLRIRITAAVLIMVLLMLCTGGLCFFYFLKLSESVKLQSDRELPALQVLNGAQLSITRLSNLANEVANSTSPAYSRILMSQVRDEISELQNSLLKLTDRNEQITRLTEIVAKVEPSVTSMSMSKAMLDQVEAALQEQVTRALRQVVQTHKGARQAAVEETLDELLLELNHLLSAKHLYEQNQIVFTLKEQLTQLNRIAPMIHAQLSPLLSSPKGVFDLLAQREQHRSEVVGLSTQNKILLGNVVDFGHRVYMDMEANVAQQAEQLSENAQSFIDGLVLAFAVQLLVALSLLGYLHRQLFRRLQALKGLVGQKRTITDEDVAFFDAQNELGSLVKKLQSYMNTITTQQAQIETTSQQLQTIIKHSHMKIAVLIDGQLQYCSDALKQLFANRALTSLESFPDDVVNHIKAVLENQANTEEGAFWDVESQSWYDITRDTIIWQNQHADLISFADVTEQIQAQQEFKRTLSEVENEAQIDPLTGLLNRKTFDTTVMNASHEEMLSHFAILLFDVDFFKEYNDQLGHLQGDNVLKMVAAVIQRNTPSEGAAIRYGGEELLVYLPDTQVKTALDIAQTIVEDIFSQDVPHPASPHRYLSVSCGVSMQTQATESVLQVFDQADKSLYKAKRSGRNCVMLWSDTKAEQDLL